MLQKYLVVIVLIFALMLTHLEAHQLFGEKLTAVKDTYASHGRKLSIQIARSRLDCNRQCRNTEFCNAVNFGNKTCELLALNDDYENNLQSRPGWTLSYMSDACTSEPCQNGGTCNSLIRRYDCDCMPGYTNTACDFDIDECSSNPCQPNGVCNDAVNSYNCDCNTGYEGDHCETDIDECSSDPCQPNGMCVDDVNSYRCDCNAGYEGDHCETETDECSSNPCQHSSVCNDVVNSYSCDCNAGYEGNHCETETDECSSNPCQPNGVCVDAVNSYSCDCNTGYEGDHCETEINVCSSNPCPPYGVCIDAVNSYSCECNVGYVEDDSEHLEAICHGGESPAVGVTVTVSNSYQNGQFIYDGDYICLSNFGWSTPQPSVSQWVEVDIGSERLLVKIATMGNCSNREWVTRYELYKMDSGNTLIGQFSGNSDQNTPKYHVLSNPITVRIVRIVSLEWYSFTGMRVGLFVL